MITALGVLGVGAGLTGGVKLLQQNKPNQIQLPMTPNTYESYPNTQMQKNALVPLGGPIIDHDVFTETTKHADVDEIDLDLLTDDKKHLTPLYETPAYSQKHSSTQDVKDLEEEWVQEQPSRLSRLTKMVRNVFKKRSNDSQTNVEQSNEQMFGSNDGEVTIEQHLEIQNEDVEVSANEQKSLEVETNTNKEVKTNVEKSEAQEFGSNDAEVQEFGSNDAEVQVFGSNDGETTIDLQAQTVNRNLPVQQEDVEIDRNPNPFQKTWSENVINKRM